VPFIGEVRLESNGLLNMKLPKVAKLGIALESMDRLCHPVERAFAEAFRLLQEDEIPPLDPLVPRIVCLHVKAPPLESQFTERDRLSAMCDCACGIVISSLPRISLILAQFTLR
jgi:hypothetical protein